MDIATVIGLLGGASLVLSAIILGGSAGIFINVPGLLIVVGGSIATAFMKFTMAEVIGSIKVAMKAFLIKVDSPDKIISDMVSYTRIAKKEGLIALEKEKPEDNFAAKALAYLSDGYDEGLISDMLNKDIRLTVQRHTLGQSFFKGIGATAPAFGMIGTLIGLVQMLANMSDPASIGPSMAVALLTTLYGAVVANLVCIPIAEKLKFRCDEEQVYKNIIVEGAVAITRGIAPMVLEESLKIFLSPKKREQTLTDKDGDSSGQ
ncbi:MAG: MotA/TolQ/ExbB proton channel family protein [Deltaproteobacteria bacterium]|nr:MotA/TolQ/ExbB proton channel family protein [Deltaproteobacteria bacterium]